MNTLDVTYREVQLIGEALSSYLDDLRARIEDYPQDFPDEEDRVAARIKIRRLEDLLEAQGWAQRRA
jgi:hypothetical protein